MNHYIVIEGNIGAGKTSFVRKYVEDINARAIYERFADNDFLAKFYADPEKYAFTLEMSFLADRFHQLKKELNTQELFSNGIVSDYFLMKSLIFARSTLSEDEYRLYRDIFEIIYQRLSKPDIYVYLHKTPDTLLKNISKRGRTYEETITKDYLKSIEDSYFTFFKQHSDLNPLIIDAENLDFVTNKNDYLQICKIINNAIEKNEL
ncbi:MAG: deoxynucleoside kinase [Bacteroidota bacterium]|nr:deoxynucleoside kinase [Bacteroidota bacterium]